MEPRIEKVTPIKLIGESVQMSLVNNRTLQLWKGFMTNLMQSNASVGYPRYSIQVYEAGYFQNFNPQTTFTKWACIKTDQLHNIPKGFSEFLLDGGQYAVFDYKGTSTDFSKMAQWIYGQWLPNSRYELDHRPHFELLGEKYRNNHPESEEEVWIPIKHKRKN